MGFSGRSNGKSPAQPLVAPKAPWWEPLWRGMPAFTQRDVEPHRSVELVLRGGALRDLGNLIAHDGWSRGRRAERYTPSTWFPVAEIGSFAGKRWVSPETEQGPRHPVYVISKGRWETQLTSKHLSAMGIQHHVVVEAGERDAYEQRASPLASFLTLDSTFQDGYDACDQPGDPESKGSGPARNFVWEHAAGSGAERHWIMDDNIDGFYRLHGNLKTPAGTPAVFRAMEEFVDRHHGVALAGPNYFMFASRKSAVPPFYINTRVYSCILIRNDLPFRWRGRYNEDTDLSLRALKGGAVTVLFNAFLQLKSTTMTMTGGNTDTLYQKHGRLRMATSLRLQHPDVTTVTRKWGRWQHHVDYSRFRAQSLLLKSDVSVPEGPDEFGMQLEVDGTLVDDPAEHLA